jgi:hypothetical protein
VVPLAADRVTLSLPGACEDMSVRHWLALRIVYADASVNPLASFDPLVDAGPRLTSAVSAHLARSVGPYVPFEDPYVTGSKENDLADPLTARPGDPVEFLFRISGYAIVTMPLEFALSDTFDTSCLDLSGFDPLAEPGQVLLAGAPAPPGAVAWDATSATLSVVGYVWAQGYVPEPELPPYVEVSVRGLRAGSGARCCNQFSLATPCGWQLIDDTCFAIDPAAACAVLPERVSKLRVVKSGSSYPRLDVWLAWDAPGDPSTVGFDVWAIADKRLIAAADRETATREPALRRVGTLAHDAPGTFDYGVIAPYRYPGPDLIFYQVRGLCLEGSEGPL